MSTELSFAVLGGFFLLVALHPFATYPLSLLLVSRFRRSSSAPGRVQAEKLSCAICVCAYNEEHVIERKVQNLLALREREGDLAIHMYVDAASDRTAEILRRYADRIDLHVATERHGKTHGMNLLVARTNADVIIFTDANVMMDPDCVRDFRRYFEDPAVGCVSGNLVYTNAGDSAAAASGSLYWRFEEGLKRLEGRTGSVMGADGSVFALRRSLHQPPPDHIIDDLYVSLMALCQGYRVIQATDARGYEESVPSSREEFRRKVRIVCQAFNVHRLIWPQIRTLDGLSVYKYISHKLIRWLAIYFLGLSVLSFGVALLIAGYTGLAVLGIGVLGVGYLLGAVWSVRPFAQIVEILSAFLAAGIGVWSSLRGERYQTWNPAASIRQKPVAT